MSGRENILNRVRAAVARPAPKLFERDEPPHGTVPQFLPVGDGFEAMRNRLAEELTALRGEFFAAADGREANAKLRELVARFEFKNVVAQDTPEMRCLLHEIPVKWLGDDYHHTGTESDAAKFETARGGIALDGFDLAVTHCDALVARLGSVVLTAKSAGGRALSVLPPNHLVVARREQLVADLSDALALLRKKYGVRLPSFITVTTGPSRTSDIEKMLVLGAHGPKKLFVMVVG